MTFEGLMGAYKINDDLCNKAVYDELLKQLKNDRVTPVIGAGLSKWAKYPLWKDLLTDKAKSTDVEAKVYELINNNEFEKAATVLSNYYKPNKFLRTLQKEFSAEKLDESKRPSFQHRLKVIFKGPFVTTNYDKALENLLVGAYVVNPRDKFTEASINEHIQSHNHFLVKLHGSVDDKAHLILTEESYNEVYGNDPEMPDRDLPLPKALESIFKASPPLFLGCSLDKDRTCAVFKNCVGTTGFALVEKPDNQADFDEKDAQLDDMNLQVIWYPHGKHEAVGVLINQLAKDMGIDDPSDPDESTAVKPDKQEIQYSGSEYFIGRDSIVNDIAKKINSPETKVLLVHGMAGIGKTEICKAVYRKLKAENPDFSMPFVDITGKSSLPDFWKSIADGLDIDVPNTLPPEKLFDFICNHVYNKNYIAYLDNFEDILIALDKSGQKNLIHYIYKLTEKYGLRLLISSQEPINDVETVDVEVLDGNVDVKALSWEKFIDLDQVKLFVEKYYNKDQKNKALKEMKEDERNSFRNLISELSGHPLAIILTALSGKDTYTISELQEIWLELEETIPGDKKDAHESFRLSVKLAWQNIKENKAAVIRWALHSHSIMPLDSETLKELNSALKKSFSTIDWAKGKKALRDHGLTYETEDDKEQMLLALKKLFPKIGAEAEEALKKAFSAWINVCGEILERGDNRKLSDRQACHDRALDFLPQCFNLAESCLDKEEEEKNVLLTTLLRSAYNFYQFDVINSIPLLNKLIEKTDDDFPLRGRFYNRLGDLLRRTGEPKKALEAYDEAEKLSKSEQANLGLANVLSSRGDLLSRTGELEKALEAYDEAEKLYKSEQANLGLANVLSSRGNLLRRTGELEKALEAYDEAEELCRQEKYNLGLANVLKSRGNLLSRTGELEKALEAYDEAEKLYKSEQANLGLANVLRSRGDLLSQTGELEKAPEAYDEAEKLYKSEQDNLGLANVLRCRGNLKSIQEDWKGAEEEYEKALPLYFQEQETMGASYTLADLQICKKHLGDDDGREKCLEMLSELLPKQPEPVQNYVKRRIEIADSL